MIRLRYNIANTDKIINHRIVLSVVRDIIKQYGLPKDTYYKFDNNVKRVFEGNELTHESVDTKHIIEVTISEIEEPIDNRLTNTNTFRPVISNEKDNITVRPIYLNTRLTLTCLVKSKFKTTVERLRAALKTQLANGNSKLHQVSYDVPIIDAIIERMRSLYNTRVSMTEEETTFVDYLTNMLVRPTYLNDINGQKLLMFNEEQTNVYGNLIYEYSNANKIEKEDSFYTLEFNYDISIEKPTHFLVEFPFIICNKIIDMSDFSRDWLVGDELTMLAREHILYGGMDVLNVWDRTDYYLRIPFYDYFKPTALNNDYKIIFSVLTSISKEDRRTLFNISDLGGEYELIDIYLDYIKNSDPVSLLKYYDNVFLITLYRNNNIIGNDNLIIDEDLNISATSDLNIEDTYRVLVSVITDVNLLTAKGREDFLKSGLVFNGYTRVVTRELFYTDFNKVQTHYDLTEFIKKK
jgi:hypothetical protein